MRTRWLVVGGLAVMGIASPAQETPADEDAEVRAFRAELAADGITVDLDAREVRVPGYLRRDRPDYERPVELGIVTDEGATHEALGVLGCTPSLLNAALLWIGLEPGRPRRYELKDPLPPEEDIELGLEFPYVVHPPQGDRVFIDLRWEAGGEPHVLAMEDLLVDLRTGEPIPMVGFVYVGSRFVEHPTADGTTTVYAADLEGNIALFYPDKVSPEGCLLDVFATDPAPYRTIDVDADRAPPLGTPITFVFTPVLRSDARPLEPELESPRLPDAAESAKSTRHPMLRDADPALLAKIGTRSFDDVERMLQRGKSPLKEVAAGLLGAWGNDEAVQPLGDALRRDRDPMVRLSAAYALADLESRASLEALVETLDFPWWEPREDALFALRLCSGRDLGRRPDAWRAWLEAHLAGE